MPTIDRSTPEGAARYFQHCIREGDVEGALSCFDAQAVYIPSPGAKLEGTAEIRKGLEMLCGMNPDLQAQRCLGIEVGDLASWVDEWSLRGTLPDGTVLTLTGVSSDILKRQPNGHWAYLVDNPYGAAALDGMARGDSGAEPK